MVDDLETLQQEVADLEKQNEIVDVSDDFEGTVEFIDSQEYDVVIDETPDETIEVDT